MIQLEARVSALGVFIIQLLADPAKYDGKRVMLSGYIHLELEGSGIYLPKEDFERQLTRNGLWVGSMAERLSRTVCQDAYVLIEGTFHADITGHKGLWSGATTDITRCIRWSP